MDFVATLNNVKFKSPTTRLFINSESTFSPSKASFAPITVSKAAPDLKPFCAPAPAVAAKSERKLFNVGLGFFNAVKIALSSNLLIAFSTTPPNSFDAPLIAFTISLAPATL